MPRCTFIEFLNHPRRASRKQCGTELMKKVKTGQTYKFVPRKLYVYYNVIDAMEKLVSRPGFLQQCEGGVEKES